MNPGFAAAAVGVALIIAGVLMIRSHRLTWAKQQQDPETDEFDRSHYRRRYQRRLQTSGLLVVLGVLIPAGDLLIPADAPRLFTAWVALILILTIWVIVLGMGDMLATTAHSRVAIARIRQKQEELERAAQQARRQRTNGSSEKINGGSGYN
ncbi:MAG: hypothetical protein KDA79_15120 [Planctomycetaceae bacterium]|nr:hypothetical protein [Planctomycetaceae bacterium]